jgi:AmmeMemoRadiSam system protein B
VFRTPLGDIEIDQDGKQRVRAQCNVAESDAPHAREHALEVQLPFLQETLGDFKLLPIVVGSAPAHYVSSILDQVWGGDETLVLASSDLSHYHPYARAQAIDAETSRCILNRDPTLSGDQACGAVATTDSCTPRLSADCRSGNSSGSTPVTRQVTVRASLATEPTRCMPEGTMKA